MKDYFQQADSPYFSTKATNEFIHSWQQKCTPILWHFRDKLWWATQLLDGLPFVTFINERCETMAIKNHQVIKSPGLDTVFFVSQKFLGSPKKIRTTKSPAWLVSKGESFGDVLPVFVDFFSLRSRVAFWVCCNCPRAKRPFVNWQRPPRRWWISVKLDCGWNGVLGGRSSQDET